MSERRLAAIMFTDIVGYTSLMGSDEDRAFEVLSKNREIHTRLIEQFNGTLIKEMGDGMLVSFHLASDAVYCAIEIQKACKEQNIPLKIGIHEGEVVFEEADVLGDGVNIASRLQGDAPKGCIMISGSVYRDIKNKSTIKTEFFKEKRFKNVDEPIKVYKVYCEEEEAGVNNSKQATKRNLVPYFVLAGLSIVVTAILLWQFLPTKDVSSQIIDVSTKELDKSIAVLPFRDDSQEKDNQYFCDGMMEEILTHLQKIVDLNVKSRTSVEQYRNTTKTIETIAEELNVPFILEGSVRKYGDNFRITVQLIKTSTGNHLWAETFDGAYTDTIFIVQASIAKRIASSLSAAITPFEKEQIEKSPTSDIRAYDKFLKGRESLVRFWNYGDIKDIEKAQNLFIESLEIDPEFAWGYSGLAQIYLHKAYDWQLEEFWDSVYIYAEKVIEYDHNNGMGYAMKGAYFREKGDFDKALDSYKKSVEVNPNFPWFYENIWQTYYKFKHDYRSGLPYLKKTEELVIKQDIYSEQFYNRLGQYYIDLGDYEKAERYLNSSLEVIPSCGSIGLLIWLMSNNGEFDKAIDFLDSIIIVVPVCTDQINKDRFYLYLFQKEFDQAEENLNLWVENGNILSVFDSICVAYLNKELGREQDALTILHNSRNSIKRQLNKNADFFTYLSLAQIHTILDEQKEALKYLSEAAKIGFEWGWQDLIEIFPPFENLWGDSEFKAIVKKAQDKKAAIRAQIKEMEELGEIDL